VKAGFYQLYVMMILLFLAVRFSEMIDEIRGGGAVNFKIFWQLHETN